MRVEKEIRDRIYELWELGFELYHKGSKRDYWRVQGAIEQLERVLEEAEK